MNARTQRKRAFSLIEIMIALTIMSVLLTIILIPLRLGFDSLHVGQANSNNQTSIQSALSDIEKDLRQAAYVFPNSKTPDITNQTPFSTTTLPLAPYTRSQDATINGRTTVVKDSSDCPFAASGNTLWSNSSRIDMIPAARDASGAITLPIQPAAKMVTYYPRRLNINQNYDPIDNPLVLFRAEYDTTDTVADITDSHVPSSCPGTTGGPLFAWLAHNVYGEANLQNIATSHTLATPRGLSLVASRAFRINNGFPDSGTVSVDKEAPLKPDSSFTCLDTDGDGKIDRVAISLAIVSYDSSGGSLRNGQPAGQSLRAEDTITLPNIQ